MHYPPLNQDGRWEIWNNFIHSLKDDAANVNFEELRSKVDVLARHNLNGRQIRNAVKTAMQLALYRNMSLGYSHLEQTIKVVNEFEEYVEKTHGHTDEEWVKSQRTRLE
jgi:SpoVK/Ycf46/Vps4 family AAA+-type ATPase